MKSRVLIVSVLIFFLTVTLSLARTWTAGAYRIEGEFLRLADSGTKVLIRKADGKKVKIALEKLSEEDQAFVNQSQPSDSADDAVLKAIPKSNWYAFIVGVNTYADDELPNLLYCVTDAKALAKKFRQLGFLEGNITLLVDSIDAKEQPTRDNIKNQIEKMVAKLPEDSLIIFSFAGHGIEIPDLGAYFLPSNCYMSKLPDSAISAKEVVDLLESSNAQVKLMIVDACRVEHRGPGNFRGFNLKDPKGLAFLQSCSYDERSYEDETNRHGYFTQTFLEAMEGKADANEDGEVTLSEIFAYTSSETETRVSEDRSLIQRPFYSFKGTAIPNYALVTGLLVDGLTKAQRDEAEKLYQEAHVAFLKNELSLAETKINDALAIYPKKELYEHEKTLIVDALKEMKDSRSRLDGLTETMTDTVRKTEAAREKLRKKEAELKNVAKKNSSRTQITSLASFEWVGTKITKFIGGETDVVIPDGMTEIGDCAFKDCSSLTSVMIPESVKVINFRAFSGCKALKNWNIPENHPYFKSVDGCLLTKDGKTLIACPAASGECRIPEGVKEIAAYAFYGCTSLTSVVIPKGIEIIERDAFSNCSALTSIVIPESIKKIGNYAFSGCASLKSVEMPAEVVELGDYVFLGCGLLTPTVLYDSDLENEN